MKKSFILAIVVLASLFAANAQEIESSIISQKSTLLPGQSAEFLLSLTSNTGGLHSLSISDDFWRAKIDPKFVNLQPGSPLDNIKVSFFPLNSAKPGQYNVNVRVIKEATKEIIKEIPFNVVLVDKEKAIKVEIITSSLDPGLEENLLQVKFTNNYNIGMKDIKVSMDSRLFTNDAMFDLLPGESKVEDIIVKVDKRRDEGSYDINMEISLNGVIFAEVQKSINVGKINDVKRRIATVGGLFTSIKEVQFVNEGNTIVRQTYTEGLSALEDFFTSTSPEPSYVQELNGERIVGWDLELRPGESKIISVKTGYRGFLIVIIALLVIVGLWYMFVGKDISLSKKVVAAHGEHDAFGRIRVNLNIKNRSKDKITNIRLMDRLPGYLKPESEEFIGRKPESIKKDGHGFVIIWTIDVLGRGEEVNITYRVKSKLHVFGKLSLPSAVLRYKSAKGKVHEVHSNKMSLLK